MSKLSDDSGSSDDLRNKIIGLGEKSIRKSYYPELQQRINELEIANARLQQQIREREKIVAEQKKLEEQLHRSQKLESLGTLAGGIAHDFNNILAPILGYAELVASSMPDDNPQKTDIEQIVQAALRARALVRQILDYSRPGKGEFVEVNLNDVVREALGLIRASMPTSIEIHSRFAPDCGAIMAEPTKLHQVIMNLCTNAMHAMRETGGDLTIVIEPVELGAEDIRMAGSSLMAGAYIKMEISDTGCGMERHVLDKIFDPYFTTRKTGEGTGLGLSGVHSIVRHHCGFINCYSEPGTGTVFRVYFPRIVAGSEMELFAAIEEPGGGNESILVVDDEEVIGALMVRSLKQLGYHVTYASEPLAAIETFYEAPEKFDLIISDVTMPGINGVELVARIHQLRPGFPIILCSGFSDLLYENKAAAIGVGRYLMKPVIRRDLAKAVRQLLDKA
jgi:signal transduction histidine kinase